MVEFTEQEKRLIIYALMFTSENTAGLTDSECRDVARIIKKLSEDK